MAHHEGIFPLRNSVAIQITLFTEFPDYAVLFHVQHAKPLPCADRYLYNSDVTFDLKRNDMTVHNNFSEDWKVTLVNTGAIPAC